MQSLKKINVVLCTRIGETPFTQTPVNTSVAWDLLPTPFMGEFALLICYLPSIYVYLFYPPTHVKLLLNWV